MAKKPMLEDEGMPGAPFWMTTYGDMVTLLLTFFILMFSMSSIDAQKFREARDSLIGALGSGVLPSSVGVVGEASTATGTAGISRERIDMLASMERIAEIFQEEALEELTTVQVTGPGEILVRMGDELLFDPGESELKPQARRVLERVGNSVIGKTETINVEGHTDNIPINTPEFPSNWELSAARALQVVRLLEDIGVPPEQLAPVGRSQYKPVAPNDTPENRAKNRRVELWITWSNVSNE